jgi:hypothetical protein
MHALSRTIARLRLFVDRAHATGVSVPRAVFLELPRALAQRAYNRMATSLYAQADRQRLFDRRFTSSLASVEHTHGRPRFFVIVVPNVMHFLAPAVEQLAGAAEVVFVLNGASAIEEDFLSRRYPSLARIRVPTLPRAIWPHGHLLSLMLRTSPHDFGICDHDFYLFDRSILNQLAFRDNEFALCATHWRNRTTGLLFPGTHFLYLHVAPLREIMERHRVDARLYKHIPKHVVEPLQEMGLSLANPPKEYQSFFDSFLMLSALAMQENNSIRVLDLQVGRGYEHVGGTSMGNWISKDALHHYTAAMLLAGLDDQSIVHAYRQRGLLSTEQAKRLRATLDPGLAARVDALIDRLQPRSAADGTTWTQ